MNTITPDLPESLESIDDIIALEIREEIVGGYSDDVFGILI